MGKKEEIKYPNMWAVIDYSDDAKELCVGGKQNLKIYIYNGNYLVDVIQYSEGKVELLKEKGIPVVSRAIYDVPIECLKIPKRKILFGRIRW